MRTKSRADLLHVRRLIVEVIEQEGQFATRRSRVEIMTEVDSLRSGQVFELAGRREVDGLKPQHAKRDSAVLGACVARVTQPRALLATSQRGNIRCLRSSARGGVWLDAPLLP